MADCEEIDLTGRRFLVVEDDFIVGIAICHELEALGATIIGFCADIASSMASIATAPAIDVAIVDLDLDGVPSTPVVDTLLDRGVPTILCTGYENWSVEERFRSLPRCEKPFTRVALFRQLKALPSLGMDA